MLRCCLGTSPDHSIKGVGTHKLLLLRIESVGRALLGVGTSRVQFAQPITSLGKIYAAGQRVSCRALAGGGYFGFGPGAHIIPELKIIALGQAARSLS
eukprot:gene21736-biopygen7553